MLFFSDPPTLITNPAAREIRRGAYCNAAGHCKDPLHLPRPLGFHRELGPGSIWGGAGKAVSLDSASTERYWLNLWILLAEQARTWLLEIVLVGDSSGLEDEGWTTALPSKHRHTAYPRLRHTDSWNVWLEGKQSGFPPPIPLPFNPPLPILSPLLLGQNP